MKNRLLLTFLVLLTSLSAFAASGIYLKGDVNGWASNADWEFNDEGTGVYTLYNKTLSGKFKIADDNWTTYNHGLNIDGDYVTMNETYTLTHAGYNIICPKEMQCTKITFTVPASGEPKLLSEGADAAKRSGLFLHGDINSWGTSTAWELLDEGNGVYTLYNKQIRNRFKIANEDWSVEYGASSRSEERRVGKEC